MQVGAVRRWIQGILPNCDPVSDLISISSELAANAVAHTRSNLPHASFSVQVGWSAEYARAVVGDGGAASEPAVKLDSMVDTSGRGLAMVAGLAAGWGIAGSARGRWVWADVLWASEGRPPLPELTSGNPTELELAGLLRSFPSARIWFGRSTKTWWAFSAATASLIEAPSPAALRRMLAINYLGSAPIGADLSRLVAAPVAPASGTFPPPLG
jgi:hypothetical protein